MANGISSRLNAALAIYCGANQLNHRRIYVALRIYAEGGSRGGTVFASIVDVADLKFEGSGELLASNRGLSLYSALRRPHDRREQFSDPISWADEP